MKLDSGAKAGRFGYWSDAKFEWLVGANIVCNYYSLTLFGLFCNGVGVYNTRSELFFSFGCLVETGASVL